MIGLPALRLEGLYLALITLMAAGAITVVLRTAQFPNGGSGFFGNSASGDTSSRLPRPSLALGDTAYYRYCVVVAGLMFLLALWHVRGKAGRAWAALRQSQATAVAAGVNTTLYKLWAFALASFMAGVAGGLLAAASGGVAIGQFPVQNSILLLAVVLMGGVYNLWGAVVAALLLRLLPALLDDWGVSTEVLTILFGIGVLQVLLTAPGGLVEQVPKDLAKLGRAIGGAVSRRPSAERAVVIEVDDLTVRFGGVVPIDRMTLTFPGGTCGLIGPNGAGKTTFFNVLSGFVRPARRHGHGVRRRPAGDGRLPPGAVGRAADVPDRAGDPDAVGVRQRAARPRAHGRELGDAPPGRHGRRRVRRPRAPRPRSGRHARRRPAPPRRGRPGRRRDAAARAARRAGRRPARRGDRAPRRPDPPHPGRRRARLVILVDHDMSLVSACCETTAVLDFGRLIASGQTADVLRDEQVMRAYLGTEEVA